MNDKPAAIPMIMPKNTCRAVWRRRATLDHATATVIMMIADGGEIDK
ncbi:MAG: hypothetical protein JW795_06255 [Chitinivibrionales bacterium]|nr:hypothetical protein [Chitinivibrionales bacterium]